MPSKKTKGEIELSAAQSNPCHLHGSLIGNLKKVKACPCVVLKLLCFVVRVSSGVIINEFNYNQTGLPVNLVMSWFACQC
ncbi:hypothetical protein L3X38_045167 [Prunus dulcis]|uniref:Uncharacterized protein n=1 Tax=Prunus dulcis TaxID=3755 RepID=A0AAD4V1V7_PRUDU|nr:hypothetical protein L3X38_045167 [Prunus dulcis]